MTLGVSLEDELGFSESDLVDGGTGGRSYRIILQGFRHSTVRDRTVAIAVKWEGRGFGKCRSERH